MYIHRLVTDADTKLFFMSRPRRFGKSLTVSALKALFSGRRELFKGLSRRSGRRATLNLFARTPAPSG